MGLGLRIWGLGFRGLRLSRVRIYAESLRYRLSKDPKRGARVWGFVCLEELGFRFRGLGLGAESKLRGLGLRLRRLAFRGFGVCECVCVCVLSSFWF